MPNSKGDQMHEHNTGAPIAISLKEWMELTTLLTRMDERLTRLDREIMGENGRQPGHITSLYDKLREVSEESSSQHAALSAKVSTQYEALSARVLLLERGYFRLMGGVTAMFFLVQYGRDIASLLISVGSQTK